MQMQQWRENVVILTKFTSVAALEVVKMANMNNNGSFEDISISLYK